MTGFKILTEYEVGRAISYIEWVAGGDKPLAELGCRKDIVSSDLQSDLDRCIEISGESVGAFIIPADANFWAYGFYIAPWTLDVLEFLLETTEVNEYVTKCLTGLLFGYSPHAIQGFLDRPKGIGAVNECIKGLIDPADPKELK